MFTASLYSPSESSHSKLCRLSSATIFLAEIGDISLDAATGSEHTTSPTITLFAPISTVGNAVMGSVSKLVKVGDFVHYVVNAGSSVCLLPIHFIYLLKIPLKLDIGILLFCFECGERLCNTWSQSC